VGGRETGKTGNREKPGYSFKAQFRRQPPISFFTNAIYNSCVLLMQFMPVCRARALSL
jgi:hypothetical protein